MQWLISGLDVSDVTSDALIAMLFLERLVIVTHTCELVVKDHFIRPVVYSSCSLLIHVCEYLLFE